MVMFMLAVLPVAVVTVHGFARLKGEIPNGEGILDPCDPVKMSNLIEGTNFGHTGGKASNGLNKFGQDFRNVGMVWTRELCMMDSDGDGMLNGVELGDETCSWNKGDASPGPVKGHPGVCEPIWSADCRAKNDWMTEENCPPLGMPPTTPGTTPEPTTFTPWPTTITPSPTNPQDYSMDICSTETFSASCSDSEVILMSKAVVGRMQVGRCIDTDMGFLGCQEDKLQVLDRWCSGRNSCTIEADHDQLTTEACLNEATTYLHVEYDCLPVDMVANEGDCDGPEIELPRTSSGYISNMFTGGIECFMVPGTIAAPTGYAVNVTLYYFNHAEQNDGDNDDICHVIALIEEHIEGTEDNKKTVCKPIGGQRISHMYLSSTNQIQLYTLEVSYSLIYYEVISR